MAVKFFVLIFTRFDSMTTCSIVSAGGTIRPAPSVAYLLLSEGSLAKGV